MQLAYDLWHAQKKRRPKIKPLEAHVSGRVKATNSVVRRLWVIQGRLARPAGVEPATYRLGRRSLYPLSYGRVAGTGGEIGGAEGDRTLDLRIANATLSQLSYRPTNKGGDSSHAL